MNINTNLNRSAFKIMSSLVLLLNSLWYIMILAILNGSLGFISSMSVVIFGVIGIAKLVGENIELSYTVILILIGVSGLIRGALKYFEQYSNHFIAFKLLAILRNKIFFVLRSLAPAKLENKQKGDIISMITADIETLEIFYAHTISPIVIALVVSLLIILILGFLINWYFALIALIAYLVIGVVVPIITSKKLKKSSYKYRNQFSDLNSYMLESINGMEEITFYGATKKRLAAIIDRTNNLLKETRIQKKIISKNNACFDLLITLFIIITVTVGVVLHYYDNFSIGKFLIGLSIIFTGFGPVIALANLPSALSATLTSGNRVLDLLQEKPLIEPIENGNHINFEKLEINNLNFGYDDSKMILKNVNINVKKGEIIGIMGPSGLGKSTILKLIMRFYPIKVGSIKINDIEINNINTDNLHKNVSMLSQNAYLFNMTIKENLLLANPTANDEQIIEACKLADIHHFIMEQPEAYNTQIASLSQNISAGQKQRIGLARVILTNSPLILLDEPTSNVDILSEKEILTAILKIKQNKAIIIVSHRPTTMSITDRIYKINKNKITEIYNGK